MFSVFSESEIDNSCNPDSSPWKLLTFFEFQIVNGKRVLAKLLKKAKSGCFLKSQFLVKKLVRFFMLTSEMRYG